VSRGMVLLPVASGTGRSDNMVLLPLSTGGAQHRFLIDEVGDAGGAYSFQALSTTYAGPVVNIRRASDDEAQDFTAAQVISDLPTFLDSTTGFVVTWYDQAGSNDVTQATTASQPQALQDDNGYWFANCTAKHLAAASFIGSQTNSTVHVIWQCQSDGAISVTSPQGGINLGSSNNILVPWWTTTQSPNFKDAGSTSFNWADNHPRQHVFKFLNGTETSFEFASDGRTPYTVANPAYDELDIGASLVDGNFRVYEFVVFTKDADQDLIFQITKNNYPAFFTLDTLWLNMGDSNTAAGFSHPGSEWTAVQVQTQPITGPYFSRALGGYTIQHFLDNPDDMTFFFENFTYTDSKVILFLGTNDLVTDGITGAEAYAKLVGLAGIMRDAGAATIAAITMLPRTTGAPNFDTNRDEFNDLLIANADDVFDIVIDTTANPDLQDQNDTTYFADTTHLNDTGQAVLASMVVAAF